MKSTTLLTIDERELYIELMIALTLKILFYYEHNIMLLQYFCINIDIISTTFKIVLI
jgi:hypothetical protein